MELWSTAIVFNAGHRIRIAISSSNDPRFDPNPNTGHPFRADDETRTAVAAWVDTYLVEFDEYCTGRPPA